MDLHYHQKNNENEIVSIPGLRGHEPKEISVKNLSKIIKARLEEILNDVNKEIRLYQDSNHQRNKLIAGVVLTGGGANLKHIKTIVRVCNWFANKNRLCK